MMSFEVRAIVNGRQWSHVFQARDIMDAETTVGLALDGLDYSAVEITPLN